MTPLYPVQTSPIGTKEKPSKTGGLGGLLSRLNPLSLKEEDLLNIANISRGTSGTGYPGIGDTAFAMLSNAISPQGSYGESMTRDYLSDLLKTPIEMGDTFSGWQKNVEQNYPYLAPLTDALLPQDAFSVAMTPVTLGLSAAKGAGTLAKTALAAGQGTLNAMSGPSSANEASQDPPLSDDILDQIANEGRGQTMGEAPSRLDQDITALFEMLNSSQPSEMQKPNKVQEFADRLLANLGNRNYDMEQLQMQGAYQDPQASFMSQNLPELLQFYMEQSARAARDMQVEREKNRLMMERFSQFPNSQYQMTPLQ